MYLNAIERAPVPFAGVDSYLGDIPAIAGLGLLELHAPVTFLVGENGSGKSTLLEAVALALGFNPEGGSKNFSFSTRDTHSGLHGCLTLHRGPYRPKDGFFLRAESFYNTATEVEELSRRSLAPPEEFYRNYGGKSLHHQSHGESFLNLVHSRFHGQGIYLLDEPEAALSPARQLTLLCELHRLVEAGSQLLIATHSPILMAYPGAEILLLGEGPIHPVEYRETEHYQITKSFLDSPERMLRVLFDETCGNIESIQKSPREIVPGGFFSGSVTYAGTQISAKYLMVRTIWLV